MKKLFVLIFTLTLSANAFSWGGDAPCDKFLDQRRDTANPRYEVMKTISQKINTTSYQSYLLGMMYVARDYDKKLAKNLADIFAKQSLTSNQILYLIEKGCRNKPTALVYEIALPVYQKIIKDELKRK